MHASQSAKGLKRYGKLIRTYQVIFCSYNIFSKYELYTGFSSMKKRESVLLTWYR